MDIVECDIIKNEIDLYSREIQSRNNSRFTCSLGYETKLTEVWRWVKDQRCRQQSHPFASIALANDINTAESLNRLLAGLVGPEEERPTEAARVQSCEPSDEGYRAFSMWEIERAIDLVLIRYLTRS